jgi:hypothetical protein
MNPAVSVSEIHKDPAFDPGKPSTVLFEGFFR